MSEDEDDEEDNDDDDDDDAVRVVEGVVGKGVNVISASCLRHHCVKLLEGKRNEWRKVAFKIPLHDFTLTGFDKKFIT